MNNEDLIDEENDDFFISRTEQKKAAQEFISIADPLIALNNNMLLSIPLSDEVRDAIDTAKKIKVGNALKRQMSFIAKLIRKSDPEPILLALENFRQQDRVHEKESQLAEQWRDNLINGKSETLSEFINKYPSCNKQKLNQLVRASSKEQQACNETPTKKQSFKQKKALFKFLREAINTSKH